MYQPIHLKLIDKAEELLLTTPLTVSETACLLGFRQLQSFSKLVKIKIHLSLLAFKPSFN